MAGRRVVGRSVEERGGAERLIGVAPGLRDSCHVGKVVSRVLRRGLW